MWGEVAQGGGRGQEGRGLCCVLLNAELPPGGALGPRLGQMDGVLPGAQLGFAPNSVSCREQGQAVVSGEANAQNRSVWGGSGLSSLPTSVLLPPLLISHA